MRIIKPMMIENQPRDQSGGIAPITEKVSEVRNNFADYIDRTRQGDRYILTLRGHPVVAIISYQDYLDAFYPWKEDKSWDIPSTP